MKPRTRLLLGCLSLVILNGCGSASNVAPNCGDGVVDEDEQCDDGEGNSDTTPNACRTYCARPFCGDNVVDDANGEQCDPPGSTCDSSCRTIAPASCGNGTIEAENGEQCDNGAENSDTTPDACRSNCTSPNCGDGVTDPGNDEQCDWGPSNANEPDTCRPDCKEPTCGDSIVDTGLGEECDDPADPTCVGCRRVEPGATGSSCLDDLDCNGILTCLTESSEGMPGGYCAEDCGTSGTCSDPNATCTEVNGQFFACLKTCTGQGGCRAGYGCWDAATITGAVCYPDCDNDAQCTGTGMCNEHFGTCIPDQGLLLTGEPCVNETACEGGLCIPENYAGDGTFQNGYCSSLCTLSLNNCPGTDICALTVPGSTMAGACLRTCTTQADCEPLQTCLDTMQGFSVCL